MAGTYFKMSLLNSGNKHEARLMRKICSRYKRNISDWVPDYGREAKLLRHFIARFNLQPRDPLCMVKNSFFLSLFVYRYSFSLFTIFVRRRELPRRFVYLFIHSLIHAIGNEMIKTD